MASSVPPLAQPSVSRVDTLNPLPPPQPALQSSPLDLVQNKVSIPAEFNIGTLKTPSHKAYHCLGRKRGETGLMELVEIAARVKKLIKVPVDVVLDTEIPEKHRDKINKEAVAI